LGYRKPHPLVFNRLVEALGTDKEKIIYVGDDPEPDIDGALQTGLRPVWTTYVRDRDIPFAPGVASDQAATPNDNVPRISDWQELLTLLDGA
jgi:FMN phosphatase YigB (HAD superfamily)